MMIVTDWGRVNDINKHLKISTIYKSSFKREELWKFYKKKKKNVINIKSFLKWVTFMFYNEKCKMQAKLSITISGLMSSFISLLL